MSKFIKTLAFTLVLGGLLSLAMSSLAQAPATSTSVFNNPNQVIMQGTELQEGVPISRDQIHKVGN